MDENLRGNTLSGENFTLKQNLVQAKAALDIAIRAINSTPSFRTQEADPRPGQTGWRSSYSVVNELERVRKEIE